MQRGRRTGRDRSTARLLLVISGLDGFIAERIGDEWWSVFDVSQSQRPRLGADSGSLRLDDRRWKAGNVHRETMIAVSIGKRHHGSAQRCA
ncbi:hypothetical protein PHSY_007135 [Pseudozyma hubeiensis SY62]|uniref:Uncharacterized protein n=1 Tax=Pseudozyma hubeiensis (strain SY62) TaxID=1305764 RepID=R9PDS3_PSEHS|nr:hypothetical protein PHSY_007135 [Pseudozyma hubeiensis SY62]GAC99533.1 hypothetical protein PHSY_007135 [Pseudozyma hubeiensis SY62]